jgi:ABC transporter, ATP-binding protein
VIIIAHRLRTVENADQIIVLDEGRIVEEGSSDELIANQGLFYKLWKTQKQ